MTCIDSKQRVNITDLPADILCSIFPYLSVRNFTNLTDCTPRFFRYRDDPAFWRKLVQKTFRLPPQPLLEGKRWKWLYEKLLTQTQLYTWGHNQNGNLGHVKSHQQGYEHLRPYPHLESSGWPRQPWVDIYIGIVSDVQCGGWCTTLLNSDGNIFIMGHLDGWRTRNRMATGHGHHMRQLSFPPNYYLTSNVSYWPSTAIKQYSTGRSNVIGLSDDGKVWEWRNDMWGYKNNTADLIVSVQVDLEAHKVLEVQAGWDRSAIVVQDVGILYWASEHESDHVRGGRQQALAAGDKLLINTAKIPGTSYSKANHRSYTEESLDAQVGQVKQFIILEDYILFTTHKNRVFSYRATFPLREDDSPQPVELTSMYPGDRYQESSQPIYIRCLVGSFRNFAIFTSSGAVLTADNNYLDAFNRLSTSSNSTSVEPLPQPTLLPSLQTGDIVSLSFGDHHLHALHSDGTITSLATESQSCGALGLGQPSESPYRGVLAKSDSEFIKDSHIPKDTKNKHTIFFEPLMHHWIQRLIWNTRQKNPAEEAHIQASGYVGRRYRERMGEWFEREGRKWFSLTLEETAAHSEPSRSTNITPTRPPPERKRIARHANAHYNSTSYSRPYAPNSDEDDLPPYFALKVASAGWHSAALVLVDEAKAEKVRERLIFPPVEKEKGWGSWATGLGKRFLGLEKREEEAEGVRYTFDEDVLPGL